MTRIPVLLPLMSLTLFVAIGCEEAHFRAETIVHSDGSIARTVYQPVDKTPDGALNADRWETTGLAGKIESRDWPADQSIMDLETEPAVASDDDRPPYFVAQGTFEDVTGIPQHFIQAGPDPDQQGRLQQELTRADFVLVQLFEWRETLTDVVELSTMQVAKKSLIDRLIRLHEATLERGLPPNTDASGWIAWLEDTGAKWLSQATDAYYETAIRSEGDAAQFGVDLFPRWRRIAAGHGVIVSAENTEESRNQFFENVQKHLLAIVQAKVTSKSDQPISHDDAQKILKIFIPFVDNDEADEPLPQALDHCITAEYGSREEFDRILKQEWTQIAGVYVGHVLWPAQRFRYQLQMPGVILETDGSLVDDDTVRWSFDAKDAYPLGYTMSARSLMADRKLQETLLGQTPFSARGPMSQYLELVEADADLLKALRECRQDGSLAPLKEFRQEVREAAAPSSEEDTRRLARLEQLWKLLELTD